ncbi:hypothetical protein WICMUC_000956 [Wickerhamomyces mucosus]|uniref:Uncharacterized protein n=1 Tax=Wickerhamomyces mucosus TaxID=1378264 RepID=A0A9P8PW76_9ASCO|nr:hypothetical protein WICMUC_000956 [Wickerhamomyces mucosus]
MAPPTLVLSKDDSLKAYRLQSLLNSPKTKCQLKSLSQFECSFDGGLYTCVPFKRVFQDCIMKNGKRQVVEVTDKNTNKLQFEGDEAKRFLNIEANLRKLYENDTE